MATENEKKAPGWRRLYDALVQVSHDFWPKFAPEHKAPDLERLQAQLSVKKDEHIPPEHLPKITSVMILIMTRDFTGRTGL